MTMHKRLLEPFNGFSHLFGAVAAVFGSIGLIALGLNKGVEITPLAVYGMSLVLLFSASAAYHFSIGRTLLQRQLQKIDHSAIFLLIAGTYTPFCLLAFDGFFRWGLLTIIWLIAFAGIGLKFLPVKFPRWLNAVLYVIMGWLCIMAAPQMGTSLPAAANFWLVAGGLAYTFGAVVYATKILNFIPGIFGFHEVWHVFVLLGAVSHFASILILVSRVPLA
jgi:hemolysin III